jgi:hypothetical protein
MAFQVIDRAGVHSEFGDGYRWEVQESGALIVSDDNGMHRAYGPAGWLELRRPEAAELAQAVLHAQVP